MANEVRNHLIVVGLQQNPEDFAKVLETEMYGHVVPHEAGKLFVEVVNGNFDYSTKWEPKISALIEVSKKYKDCTLLLTYGCWEIQRNGQVVMRNGDILENFDRIGGYGLFDDIEHPVIDLFAPYLRERTLAQCAEDRLQDAIGIVRRLIEIMDDKRFKNSPSTPYSDVRDREQTENVRADLEALLELMAKRIRQLNFTGVLLEESELRERILRNAEWAGDLVKTLGVDPLVPDRGVAARFALLPFTAAIKKDPHLIVLPVLHYTNADPTSGNYVKDIGGSFPAIEWEIRYLCLRSSEMKQIRRLPDDDQTPFDIDIIMSTGNEGIRRELHRASNKARWKENAALAKEVQHKAAEMSDIVAAKAANRPDITLFGTFLRRSAAPFSRTSG